MELSKRSGKALEMAARRLASEIEVAAAIKQVRRDVILEVLLEVYRCAVRDAVEAVSQGAAGRNP